MKENTTVELEITNIVNGGYGLGRYEGFVYMVPFAYPGDIVQIKTTSVHKNMAWGRIKKIIKASPERIEKQCPYMGICGGCMWGMLSYLKQIEYKMKIIEDNILRFLSIDNIRIDIKYDENYKNYYRTRVTLHGDGKKLGFYKLRSRKIVNINDCILIHPKIKEICKNLPSEYINSDIIITINANNNEYYLYTPIINNYLLNNYKNYNYKNQKQKRYYFLYQNVPIVNGAFSQNSLYLNTLLKEQVTPFLQGENKIIDLYCGSGNFTIDLPKTKNVVGIDIDPYSIEIAKEISDFEYQVGDESLMIDFLKNETWDIVLLDPPRTGTKILMPHLAKTKTKYILYISCEPVTMLRDIKGLIAEGWKIDKITVVDMFPQTPHVECITILQK